MTSDTTPIQTEITPSKGPLTSSKSLFAVKLAAWIMGILIIAGVIALIIGVQQKVGQMAGGPQEISVLLPKGADISAVSGDGQGGVMLHLDSSGSDSVMHLDKSGKLLRTFIFETQ